MNLIVQYIEEDYFLKLVYLLRTIPPFNDLTRKELDLYAYFLYYNDKYKTIPLRDRNKLIFNHDIRKTIAKKMGINMARVYNIVALLKKKGIIGDGELNPRYVISKVDYLAFIFKEKNE